MNKLLIGFLALAGGYALAIVIVSASYVEEPYQSSTSTVEDREVPEAVVQEAVHYQPPGYTNAGDGIAFRWVEGGSCSDPQFMVCWRVELISDKYCQSAVAQFGVSDVDGNPLGRFWSASPVNMGKSESRIVEFGSVTPIITEIMGDVNKISCTQIVDFPSYNTAHSAIDLPGTYCGGSCVSTFSPPATNSSPDPITPYQGEVTPPSNSGGGYSVTCNDGTTSYSGGKQGACSWHGGVR